MAWQDDNIISVIVAIALAIGYLAVAKENGRQQQLSLSPTWGKLLAIKCHECYLWSGCTESIGFAGDLIGRFSSAFSALAETLDNQESQRNLPSNLLLRTSNYH